MGTLHLELEEHEMRELMEMSALILRLLDQAPLDTPWKNRVAIWEGLCREILEAGQQIPSLTRELEYNAETGSYEYSAAYERRSLFHAILEKNKEISFWTQLVSRLCQRSLQADLGANVDEALRQMPLTERADLLEQTLLDEMSLPYMGEEASAPPGPSAPSTPSTPSTLSRPSSPAMPATGASSSFAIAHPSMTAAAASTPPPSGFGYAVPAQPLSAAEQRAILDEVEEEDSGYYEDYDDDFDDYDEELTAEEIEKYGGAGMRG